MHSDDAAGDDDTMLMLHQLIRASATGPVTKGHLVGSALHELSVDLCRGNAAMYRADLKVRNAVHKLACVRVY